MVPVVRTLAMYAFLVVLLRASGKRTLAQVTVFDFVLLLVMSEATQQALTGNDFSVTNAMLIVLTLVALSRGLDWFSHRNAVIDRVLNDEPLILIDDGKFLRKPMHHNEVGIDDILESARKSNGIERIEQVKYAILERDGTISVIPRSQSGE
jgi:uncharacterized membrane protein YcaP (DUF421 family)